MLEFTIIYSNILYIYILEYAIIWVVVNIVVPFWVPIF